MSAYPNGITHKVVDLLSNLSIGNVPGFKPISKEESLVKRAIAFLSISALSLCHSRSIEDYQRIDDVLVQSGL